MLSTKQMPSNYILNERMASMRTGDTLSSKVLNELVEGMLVHEAGVASVATKNNDGIGSVGACAQLNMGYVRGASSTLGVVDDAHDGGKRLIGVESLHLRELLCAVNPVVFQVQSHLVDFHLVERTEFVLASGDRSWE